MSNRSKFLLPRGRWRRGWAIGLCALALGACGGGGGVGLEGTGTTLETLASGPITGFGSIIVNGVHYDVSSVGGDKLEDLGGGGRTNANLKLGMVVEVAASAIDSSSGTPRAVASRLRVAPELLGQVDSVNLAAGTLVVMGQAVRVTSATELDDRFTNGLVGVTGVVEVFGYFDPARGQYVATRVESRSGSLTKFIVRGPVTGLTAQAFNINGQPFSYSGTAGDAGLSEGGYARVEMQTRKTDDGRWVVSGFNNSAPLRSDATEAELKGRITAYNAATPALFSVNGVPVDASVLVNNLPAGLALGVRVEVEGALRSGTLVARSVQVEDDD
ncbi:hypothetical protein BurJ1DRAFT_1349 [Burkholderiales bacterium JOSHI_001]|nr:hypothetical protein BurJ1DRAFT_1349 [Burkholderiales bacterium JOSHI_001]